jgi:hypothetical protein
LARINNPLQRIKDRLFWFYLKPKLTKTKATSSALEKLRANPDALAALIHDKALHVLIAAHGNRLDHAGVKFWFRALQAWHQVVSDDNFYSLMVALEERGAFEPIAFPSEIDTLCGNANELAGETLVVAARDALANQDTATVRRVITFLGTLIDTGSWAADAQLEITAPTVDKFRALCLSVFEGHSSGIVRDPNAGGTNKPICDAELIYFRVNVEPALARLQALVPMDHEVSNQAREEAALCLCRIASDYTWADDYITSERLSEEAYKLAEGTLGAFRIEERLAQFRNNARQQRISGALSPFKH